MVTPETANEKPQKQIGIITYQIIYKERVITMINKPVLYQIYPSYEDMATAWQRAVLEDHILDCHYLFSGREASRLPCKVVHSARTGGLTYIDFQFLMYNGRWQACHAMIPNRFVAPIFGGPGFRANRIASHVCYEGRVPNSFIIKANAKTERRKAYEEQWPAAAA